MKRGGGGKEKKCREKVRKRKDEGKTEVKNKIYIFKIGKMKATRSMRRKYCYQRRWAGRLYV
jgi:hypothetical protein